MIRPLRKRHAVLTALFLLLAAPVGLVAGVLSRPDPAVMAELPPEVLAASPPAPVTAIPGVPMTVDGVLIAVSSFADGPARFVRLAPEEDVRLPDVLVYWTPDPPADPTGTPPEGAVLIGSLAGASARTLALPEVAGSEGGSVLLYSLAHQRGLGSTSLPGAAAAADDGD